MPHDSRTCLRKLRPIIFGVFLAIFITPFCEQVTAQNNSAEPLEFKITARKFEFHPHSITVQKGKPVRLVITAEDVEHGFAIDEFDVNVKIEAKKTKVVEFTPDRAGRFHFRCTVFCGDGHDDMAGELIVQDGQTGASDLKVTFDDQVASAVIVEANGERFRIDTATKTVTRINDEAAGTPPATQAAKVEQKKPTVHEPYDYRLINVPTPKRVLRHSVNLYFTHRFSQPLKPLDQSAEALFGLDSFAVSSLGVFYGITDKLYVSATRSPLCQRGLCRTIEVGFGYHLLDEKKGRSPVALSTYASIEGDDNFTEHYTYNLQMMVARSATKYVNLFFSPAVHFNANGQRRFDPRSNEFFPPAPIADTFRQDKHAASFGFGINARIRPTISLLFEYTPRVGFKLGRVRSIFNANFTQVLGFRVESEPEIGFGIQKDIGRHSFALTFSNTQTTTTARYNSSNLVLPASKFIIGFNLYRRFLK